ncbi:YdcF family protein [Candidatus Dojkabacteria bacterium]|nr:YdcF family protein [Candidatus Dojkabacteria bacterium]
MNLFKTKRKVPYLILILLLIPNILLGGINIFIRKSSEKHIFHEQSINVLEDGSYDAILILGSGIRNNYPTPILKERLDTGIYLYENDIAPKIIMGGDHGQEYYDEVNIMKEYAIEKGVPSEDIFMDHAGFSTYESMYRAQYIFGVQKLVVVSQKYHLYRAIYIGRNLGMDVVGANATKTIMGGHRARLTREVFAQGKDFLKVILRPEPTFLGEKISLDGSGDITNDK